MASQYQQISDQAIKDRVRNKYRASITELKALSFEEFCFFGESVRALGLGNGPLGPLGVLAASPREVMKIGKDLSVSIGLLLLVSREYDTYVAPFGLGLKFYTSFTDGTLIITTSFLSQEIHDDAEKLYKSPRPGSIAEAWEHHRNWVRDLQAGGKQTQYHLSFDEYARLACKEDSYMQRPKFTGQALFGDIGSLLIGGLIFGALFSAAILIFLLWASLAQRLNPACGLVKDLGRVPLLPGLLILLASLPISWSLARVQKTMVLYDGIGTMLYGRTHLPGAHGYISTRWLVILHLPILPVRSYQFGEEISKSSAQRLPALRPLDQLYWPQIKETIAQFKWWYLLIVALWLAVGVWLLSKCA